MTEKRIPKFKIRNPKIQEDKTEDSHQTLRPAPCAVSLPIIAKTAHAMAGDEDKSLQAGMNGHVTKPIDPDQLFATLQSGSSRLQSGPAVPKV